MEFDLNRDPKEGVMIQYFREGLKLLRKLLRRVEIKKCGWELNSFKEIVEKAVDAKVKAAFRP